MSALLILVLGFAGFLQDPNQPAEPSAPVAISIASERRMFDMRSRQAWDAIRKGLDQLGFPADQTDRSNQTVLTRWRDVGGKGLEWLSVPHLSERPATARVRFLVFVSPFAEPARVSIGSVVEAVEIDGNPPRRVIGYNVSAANTALMGQITRLLSQDGLPIPANFRERRRLARSLLKDDANKCLGDELPKGAGQISRPEKILLSELPVVYPRPGRLTKTEGTVRVEFTVREDGSVTDLKIMNPALGRQLENSAIGHVSLLSFAPAKMGGCGVEAIVTYQVHYQLE